jgi:hypothetical protein
MPKQFYIAPLVCTTQETGLTPSTTCAPKVNPRDVNFTAVCQSHTEPDPQCLVLAAGNTTGADNDRDLVALVADNMDTRIDSLTNAIRNRVNSGLIAKNIPMQITDYTTVRDFLTALGQFFDPNFDLTHFFVSD